LPFAFFVVAALLFAERVFSELFVFFDVDAAVVAGMAPSKR